MSANISARQITNSRASSRAAHFVRVESEHDSRLLAKKWDIVSDDIENAHSVKDLVSLK